MLGLVFDLLAPTLLLLPPEDAHEMALRALERGLCPRLGADDPMLASHVAGLDFPNPLSLAAGFDKNGRVFDALLAMGLGFAEIGTVTPEPQTGNPRPRVFRLTADRALINRLGFNNDGAKAVLARLRDRKTKGIVGINLGANRRTEDRVSDYVKGIAAFSGVASYFTINISSPNTPGLRDLAKPEALDALLSRVMAARESAARRPKPPIFVKLSPDIEERDLPATVACLVAYRVDGIVIGNTTESRPGLKSFDAHKDGGLSGRPLFPSSTVLLARVHQASGGKFPLVGVGGIDSGAAALSKVEAGATLIQLYTGLIYEGPGLIARIKAELVAAVRRAGATSIGDLVGTKAAEWAAKSLA